MIEKPTLAPTTLPTPDADGIIRTPGPEGRYVSPGFKDMARKPDPALDNAIDQVLGHLGYEIEPVGDTASQSDDHKTAA